jgi:hypothetical protein
VYNVSGFRSQKGNVTLGSNYGISLGRGISSFGCIPIQGRACAWGSGVNLHKSRLVGLGMVAVGTLALGLGLWSQEVRVTRGRKSVPHDWSHRHLIFSEPTTLQDSVRIQGDVRYWHQREWRRASRLEEAMDDADRDGGDDDADFSPEGRHHRRRRATPIHRDWGVPLGAGATMGAGMFPAKFSFDINATANCASATTPDYVVFNTGLASTSTQASIVAFDNLYSGCSGFVSAPTNYWAYKITGTGDSCITCTTLTSPVLSLDGSQIAFVGSSSTGSFLYILKWKAGEGTVGSPAQPTTSTTSASTYVTCRNLTGGAATSCLLSLPLGSGNNTNSPPFYNYAFDMLYVGDDTGVLYKFTGVFRGTPTRVTTGGWPFTVSSSKLTAPVYDQTSGNAYVGDANGVLSFVRDTSSTVGTCGSGNPPCVGSATLNAGGGNAIVDAPIVDSTNQKVFVFVGTDAGGTRAGVFQTPTDLSSHVEATVGPQFGNTLYDGAFDNAYFTSVASGHLYACGNVASLFGINHNLALVRIGFSNTGVMNNSTDVNSLTLTATFPLLGAIPTCSPLTEISSSASSDLLFVSVTGSGSLGTCGGTGCIMSFALPTSSPFTFPSGVSHTLPESSGTSAIIVDNIVTSPTGTSQIYFTPLGNASVTFPCGGTTTGVGCAVQASQSGLN